MSNKDAIIRLMQVNDIRYSKRNKRRLGENSNDNNRIPRENYGESGVYSDATRGRIYIEPNLNNTLTVPKIEKNFNAQAKKEDATYRRLVTVVPNNSIVDNSTHLSTLQYTKDNVTYHYYDTSTIDFSDDNDGESKYNSLPSTIIKLGEDNHLLTTTTSGKITANYNDIVVVNNSGLKFYILGKSKTITVKKDESTNKSVTIKIYTCLYQNYSDYANSSGVPRGDVMYITDDAKGNDETNDSFNIYAFINGVFTNTLNSFPSALKQHPLPVLTLADFPDANTDYIIAYDFAWNVSGTLPDNIKFVFDGGSIYFGSKPVPKVPMERPKIISTYRVSSSSFIGTGIVPGSIITKGTDGGNYIDIDIKDFINITEDYISVNGGNIYAISLSNVFDRIKSVFFGYEDIQMFYLRIPYGRYVMTRPFDIPNKWSIDFSYSTVYISSKIWEGGTYVFAIPSKDGKTVGNNITKVSFTVTGFAYKVTQTEIANTNPIQYNYTIEEDKIQGLTNEQNAKAIQLKTIFWGNVQSCHMEHISANIPYEYKMYFIFQQWGTPTVAYNDSKQFVKVSVSKCYYKDFYRSVFIMGDANTFFNALGSGGVAIIGGRTNSIIGSINGKWLFVNTLVNYTGAYHEIGNIKCAGAQITFTDCHLKFESRARQNKILGIPNLYYDIPKAAIEADTQDVYDVIDKIATDAQTIEGINYKSPTKGYVGLGYSTLTFNNCDFWQTAWTLATPEVDSFLKVSEHTKVYGLDDNCLLAFSGLGNSSTMTEYPNFQSRVCPNDKLPANIFTTDLLSIFNSVENYNDTKLSSSPRKETFKGNIAYETHFNYRADYTEGSDSYKYYYAPFKGAVWDVGDYMDFKAFICLDKNRRLFYTQNDFSNTITLGSYKLVDNNIVEDNSLPEHKNYFLPGVKITCTNAFGELPDRIMGTLLVKWHATKDGAGNVDGAGNTLSTPEDRYFIFEGATLKRYGGLVLRHLDSNENSVGTKILPKNSNNVSTIIMFTNISKKLDDDSKYTELICNECAAYKDATYYNELDNDLFNSCLKVEKINEDNLRAYLSELPVYGEWREGDEVVVGNVVYKYMDKAWNNLSNPTDKRRVYLDTTTEYAIPLYQGSMGNGVFNSSPYFIKTANYTSGSYESIVSVNDLIRLKRNTQTLKLKITPLENNLPEFNKANVIFFVMKDNTPERVQTSFVGFPVRDNIITRSVPDPVEIDGVIYDQYYILLSVGDNTETNTIDPTKYVIATADCEGLDVEDVITVNGYQWQQLGTPHKGTTVERNALTDVSEGYKYYNTDIHKEQIYNGTAWIDIEDAASLIPDVVTGSTLSTTLAADINKYYRYDSPVDTLTVTLPELASSSKVQNVIVYLTAGSNADSTTITFTAATPTEGVAAPVYYQKSYDIEAGKTYEINALYNGAAWIVAAVEIITAVAQSSNSNSNSNSDSNSLLMGGFTPADTNGDTASTDVQPENTEDI